MSNPVDWTTVRHFRREEFLCKHCGTEKMDAVFVAALDAIREELGFPLVITSGYRCPQHPAEVRKGKDAGATPGAHTQGVAADVAVYGSRALALVAAALRHGFRGFGFQQAAEVPAASRFVHVDAAPGAADQPRPWVWSYAPGHGG